MGNSSQKPAKRIEVDEDSVVRSFPGNRPEVPETETLLQPHEETEVENKSIPDEKIANEQVEADAPTGRRSNVRRILVRLLAVALLGVGGWYGYGYWTEGRFFVSTDDAYLKADMSDVSSKVQGYLDGILVHENQRVTEGEVMFRLDSGDYRIAIDSAKAKLETQKETLARIKAQIEAGSVSVQQAEASRRASTAVAHNADIAYHRAEELVTRKFASQAQLDNARATLDQANAALAGADAEVASAKANVKVLEAQYAEAASQTASLKLALEQAERNFTFTELKAPFDGVVGNIADHQGDLVSPGQKLASVVPLGELYIEANFKETQLAGIEPGETARISVDALPGQEVLGRVTSIAPASGSVFSLLPPENATGNFTKVVQRVPVRIDLPEDVLATGKLRAGMSVVVDIDRRTAPSTN